MRLLSDYIKEYIAFTEDECQIIIDFYNDHLENSFRSQVYNKFEDESKESFTRTSHQMGIPFDASIDSLISQKITEYFTQYHWDIDQMYNDEWQKNKDKDIPENMLMGFTYDDEGYSIVKYDKDVGIFDWHWDRIDNDKKTFQRVYSCIIYLNDDFDEGETDFYWHKVVPQTGKIVFFPSGHHWAHKGKIPKNGDKYIITTWLYQSPVENKSDNPSNRDLMKYIQKFQK